MARMKFEELIPYHASKDEEIIGMMPLMVGFIYPGANYGKGSVSAEFLEKLRIFLDPELAVARKGLAQMCPLCRKAIELDGHRLGQSEIRILGEEDIYAAPNLIYHYAEAHEYEPPAVFVEAVLKGNPDALEYDVLIRTLQ